MYGLQLAQINSPGDKIFASYGRLETVFNNSVNSTSLNIGQTSGYLNEIGFTVSNGAGNSVSCDTTQYVITSATARNNITADTILVSDPSNAGNSLGFNFDIVGTGSGPILKSTIGGNNVGLYFYNRNYTIGEEGFAADNYLGVDSLNSRLVAGPSLLRTGVDYNNPAGFIEIIINSQSFYIELWN